jgi:hypothetical protein
MRTNEELKYTTHPRVDRILNYPEVTLNCRCCDIKAPRNWSREYDNRKSKSWKDYRKYQYKS